jgi:signal transduction histidine kinase
MRTTILQLELDRHTAGLKARILAMVDEHTQQLGFSPRVRFSGPLDHAVDEDLAGDVLAVIREGISNCARHAHASQLDVTVAIAQNILTLELTDDGRGIGTPTRSSGLRNMLRRAQRKGGSFAVSSPPAGGTHLTWKRPLS